MEGEKKVCFWLLCKLQHQTRLEEEVEKVEEDGDGVRSALIEEAVRSSEFRSRTGGVTTEHVSKSTTR